MADFSGMNIEVVKGQVVPGLRQQADACNNIVTAIDRLMDTCRNNWKGNDAKQFDQKWQGYKPQLKKLQDELRQLADTANKNADNQSQTSSTL